jgi:uncharacterized membrane protein
MEIFFVYGLVFLFFLLTLLFVIAVLPAYSEYEESRNTSAREQFTITDKKAVYGTLAAVFIGILIAAMLSEKKSH